MVRKITLTLLLLVAGGCGDDDGSDVASPSGSASGASASGSAPADECEVVDGSTEEPTGAIDVTLAEYSIEAPVEVAAGVVELVAANEGALAHEVVVLQATADEVEVGEDGAPVEVGFVGEIEAFPAGQTCEGAFSLSPGTYTLLCAIAEESGASHFGEGMVTEITVT